MKTFCTKLDKDFGEEEDDFPLYCPIGCRTVVNGITYEKSEMGWEVISNNERLQKTS